jgi:hypothetical protein
MRDLSRRTLGELAIMRDALVVARKNVTSARSVNEVIGPLLRIIDVLNAIVAEAPIARTAAEFEHLRYKG